MMDNPIWFAERLSEFLPACEKDFSGVCVDKFAQGYVLFPEHKVCQDSWLLLPGFYLLPQWLLGGVFLLLLFYCFFGVALAADQFSAGIEMVTSTTFAVTVRGSQGQLIKTRVPVWNSAVANLTLMALGTSAPEILLATIETLTSLGEPAGELGPACIVGSAAYNLMGISAVCIMAVPDGTYKKIDEFRVFIFTATCSLWAYVWMVICYSVWTPDVITLEEGLITFAFFPIMAVLAWAVDQRVWLGYQMVPKDQLAELEAANTARAVDCGKPNKVAPMPYIDQIGLSASEDGSTLSGLPPATPSAEKPGGIMTARHIAIKAMSGTKAISEPSSRTLSARTVSQTPGGQMYTASLQTVHFRSHAYGAARSTGIVRLMVSRGGGDLNAEVGVHYRTKDHDAVAGVDYESAQGWLRFAAGETYKHIEVKLKEIQLAYDTVRFFVCLDKVEGEVMIAKDEVAVSIIDKIDSGMVCFAMPKYEVPIVNDGTEVLVERRHGMEGTIAVEFVTCDDTAVAGVDYNASKGVVTFAPCEALNSIRLPMYGLSPAAGRAFKLKLTATSGSAKLGRQTECLVSLHREEKESDDASAEGTWMTQWGKQLKEAIQPRYETDENGEQIDVGILTCLLHYVCITWKVLMSVIPPADYKGGYPCFFVALFFVAVITGLTEQAANLFGCAVGLSKLITGVSLVAVGTSLPDTFASRYAAMSAPNADAAIGNITGSNSVNVFLGLGLPWVIATVYQHMKGEVFLAPAGDLSFSIIVFMPMALLTLGLLMVRRVYLGGELGGAPLVKKLTAGGLVFLWGVYLILSGLRAKGHLG